MSLLHRTYRREQRYHLGIAALALVPLRGSAALLTEMELWSTVQEHMPDVAMLDAAIPKQCPEFLVTGSAYGRYCAEGTAECEVLVKVAGLEKRIRVSGERFWGPDGSTPAQPFERIALDWAHTYGGTEIPENPLGKGEKCAEGLQALPNLEPLGQYLEYPEQAGAPISLGMQDASWPQRYRLADDYDQRWFEEDYPGFSRNIDWHYFNTAQPDQWFHGLTELPAGARYELQHMHPEHASLSGRLPAVQARCFLQREGRAENSLEEVPLRLTTVWFIPHCERAILVFHGSAPCDTFDGNDIACMLLAADDPRAARDIAHYREVLERRLDPKQGAMHALRDIDLVPEALLGPGLEVLGQDSPAGGALLQRMSQRAQAAREQLAARLASMPKSADAPTVELPAPTALDDFTVPSLDNLPAFVEAQECRRKEAEARLQSMADEIRSREAEAQARRGVPAAAAKPAPRNPRLVMAALRARLQDGSAANILPAKQRQQLEELLERSVALLATTLSLGGHLLEAQPRLDESASLDLRQQIRQRQEQNLPLATLPLAGADLSGMDLQHADLAGADLDSADLSGCDLHGANLRGTLLARAQLEGANLEDCDLTDANLGLAQLQRTCLRGANLTRTCLEHSELNDCDLSGAHLRDTRLKDAKLNNLDLSQARVENLVLLETSLEQLCLHRAQIDNLVFYRCTLRELDFSRARIRALALIETDASQGISFQAAHIHKSCFIGGSDLSRADFSACEMNEVCLRGARLEGSDFTFSQLRQTDLCDSDLRDSRLDRADLDGNLLIRSDLRGASLRSTSLMSSVLQGAFLQNADLSNSNLFRADLGEALLDNDSLLEGSYQQNVKWQPRAPEGNRQGGEA
ncbi:hypothetical protein D9M71_128660 [compost metagenome]